MLLRVRDRELIVGERTLVMGVLNVTPDSFSDGGRYTALDAALLRADALLAEGADILDIGGESTRPGSAPVSADEEARRVVPVLEALRKRGTGYLCVDTTKASVARAALDAGADIVNDVSALRADVEMASVVARSGAAVVLMHSRGRAGFHEAPVYVDLMAEIVAELFAALEIARAAGIEASRTVLDPGIGFSKTAEHSVQALARVGELAVLGRPILVGTSNKSFLGHVTGRGVDARRDATSASIVAAILGGAHLVRVHEPAAVRDAVSLADALKRARHPVAGPLAAEPTRAPLAEVRA